MFVVYLASYLQFFVEKLHTGLNLEQALTKGQGPSG